MDLQDLKNLLDEVAANPSRVDPRSLDESSTWMERKFKIPRPGGGRVEAVHTSGLTSAPSELREIARLLRGKYFEEAGRAASRVRDDLG